MSQSAENKNLSGAGHTTSGFGFLEFLFVVLFGRWGCDSVPACIPACSGSHAVDLAGPDLRDLLPLAPECQD